MSTELLASIVFHGALALLAAGSAEQLIYEKISRGVCAANILALALMFLAFNL